MRTRARQSASSLFPSESKVRERQGGPGPSPHQSSLRLARWHTAFFPENTHPTPSTSSTQKTTQNSPKPPRPWLVSCSTNAKKKFFRHRSPNWSPPNSVLIIIVVEFETLLQPLGWVGVHRSARGSVDVLDALSSSFSSWHSCPPPPLKNPVAGAAPHGWPKQRQHIWRGSHTSLEFEAGASKEMGN